MNKLIPSLNPGLASTEQITEVESMTEDFHPTPNDLLVALMTALTRVSTYPQVHAYVCYIYITNSAQNYLYALQWAYVIFSVVGQHGLKYNSKAGLK